MTIKPKAWHALNWDDETFTLCHRRINDSLQVTQLTGTAVTCRSCAAVLEDIQPKPPEWLPSPELYPEYKRALRNVRDFGKNARLFTDGDILHRLEISGNIAGATITPKGLDQIK